MYSRELTFAALAYRTLDHDTECGHCELVEREIFKLAGLLNFH